ncbi:hypothetical protein COD86_19690 [Bacillus cereus]|nr:hypothetical protein COD14_07385 [Bacillus cereus]PGV92750.1 hypothetical protein COD86_19690 [Bacillus cereus]
MHGLGEIILESLLKVLGFGFVTFLIGLSVGWFIWGWMNWVDFFGILIWVIILRMYCRYVTKQTNTTNENRENGSNFNTF